MPSKPIQLTNDAFVSAFLAALGLLLGACEASAEFLPGTPCPDGFTCFSAEPRDGVCQHPDVILDKEMKVTRWDGDQFAPERERACIMRTAGSVVRSDAGLHLKLDNAKSRSFKDKADCERNPDNVRTLLALRLFPERQVVPGSRSGI